jgi:hypothetical protein
MHDDQPNAHTAPAAQPTAQPAAPGGAQAAPRRQVAALGVISFGLAFGITCAVFVFVLGMAAGLFEWGVPVVAVLASLYIGYSPTFVGSIAGAVWAFVDGFIGGCLVAWLYNRFLIRRHHH